MNLIAFLKMLLFHRYCSAIFEEHYQKTFDSFHSSSSPFQKFTLYHSNSCMILYPKWKVQIFDPIAGGNAADTANGYQMMSYSHVETDLNLNIK